MEPGLKISDSFQKEPLLEGLKKKKGNTIVNSAVQCANIVLSKSNILELTVNMYSKYKFFSATSEASQ